jgi:uncharacterized OB-fold protein
MTRLPGQHALDQQIMVERDGRWRLMGSRCPACGTAYFPPRVLCAADLTECAEVELSARGTIYEASRIMVAPVGFTAPYWVAYVDLPERVRLWALLDWSADREPTHGDQVEYTVREVRHDPVVLGPVFSGPA